MSTDAAESAGDTIDVVVGRIGRPHALRGEVTVEVRTDQPDRRFAIGSVLHAERPPGSAGAGDRLTVSGVRRQGGTLVVSFEELADRTAAESARGIVLHVRIPVEESPEDPDEFYDHQLIGLAAYDVDGTPLGTVVALVHGAAQDLLTLETPDGHEALVPFVEALVPEVDLEAGRVVIADRPGLVAPHPDGG